MFRFSWLFLAFMLRRGQAQGPHIHPTSPLVPTGRGPQAALPLPDLVVKIHQDGDERSLNSSISCNLWGIWYTALVCCA